MTRVDIGDEILTVGGLYGNVIEIDDDDDLMLEIAPGTQVRIARRAVAAVVPPDDEPLDPRWRAKKQNATRKSAANLLRCFREP